MTPDESPARKRLIIDTDTASDDAVALLLAVVPQRAEILGVTIVAGNVDLDQATINALYTLEMAGGTAIPVHRGLDRPLVRPRSGAQHVHGSDGMSDTGLPLPAGAATDEHAVDALLRLVAEHAAGSITLVTLGPLTNIAMALHRDRTFLERLAHVYCMAGAADAVGNVSATAEFNVWADPEATAIVLANSTPERVTFVGWDVSRQDAVMTAADQRALRALGTPLARFADDINQSVNDWVTNVTGLAGYDLPDPVTMAIALDPTLITAAEAAHVTVALGDEVRGQLIVDRRHTAATPNVTLVRRADGDRFRAELLRVCGTVVPSAAR